MKKFIVNMTLLLILLLIMMVNGKYATNVMAERNEEKSLDNFAVVVKENGLWAVQLLKPYNELVLDKGGIFKKPKISPDGKNAAYIKNETLYISAIDFTAKRQKAMKVSDKIISYAWENGSELVYSTERGGIYGFNLNKRKSDVYIKSENHYEGLQSDGKGKVYGELNRYYMKNGQQYIEDKGVVSYDTISGMEKIIVPSIPTSENMGNLGFAPELAAISKDGAYVYIWCTVHSGSINTDGVQFGVYDVKNNKFTQYNRDKIFALPYSDNLAVNPVDGRLPVINNGGIRDMNVNKTLVQLNILNGNVNNILPDSMISSNEPYNVVAKGMVTMTPAFLPDGKKILFAASEADENAQEWNKEPHNIYILDTETKKVENITSGKNFDFAPMYISQNSGIAFARRIGRYNISLWRISGGIENLITSDIKIDEYSWFYGHYNIENSMDIYVHKS